MLVLRASLAERLLLQGRFDAPSWLIKTKMAIHSHFALAKATLRGNAQGAYSIKRNCKNQN